MDRATFDVIAVNLTTGRVRMMDIGLDSTNAEATRDMAVIPRGVEEEFFKVVPHGDYQENYIYPRRS